jgi:hypothetical protein
MGVIWDKSHLSQQILAPAPPRRAKVGLKLVCNVNIAYGNLMSTSSQYYAQILNESVRS